MRGEDFYEEGFVLTAADGRATVEIAVGAACEECGGKMFCSAGEEKRHTVEARDPFGVRTGDSVRIVVHGEDMFRAAFLLYGIPLVLIVAGVLIGTYLVDPGVMAVELWSAVLGVGLAGLYYLVIFLSGWEGRRGGMMPDIVFVNERK
jgi:sigma-E factor negative regulatory protein RseC